MKNLRLALIATCAMLPLIAQASCDSVKEQIRQKIIQNGVAESAFSLDVVPNDQAEQQEGLVVGHCENDQQKIVYKRSAVEADNSASDTVSP